MRGFVPVLKNYPRIAICSRKMHGTCVQIADLEWKNSLFIILLTEYHLTYLLTYGADPFLRSCQIV
jgi:hypothetical protein